MNNNINNNIAANNFVTLLKDIIQQELSKLDTTIVCRVISVQPDGTYNVYIEPDEQNIITNISSIANTTLKPQDYVYVYKVKNQLNNSFIIKKIGANVSSSDGENEDLETTVQGLLSSVERLKNENKIVLSTMNSSIAQIQEALNSIPTGGGTTAGVTDVLVDDESVVVDNIAYINLAPIENRLEQTKINDIDIIGYNKNSEELHLGYSTYGTYNNHIYRGFFNNYSKRLGNDTNIEIGSRKNESIVGNANTFYNVYIGQNREANVGTYGSYNVGIGFETINNNLKTVTIGANTRAEEAQSTSIGYLAQTWGISGIAIGDTAYSAGSNSVSLGSRSRSTGFASIYIGSTNGNDFGSLGDTSVTLGYNSLAASENSLSVGYNTYAYGVNSIAMGQGVSRGYDAVSVGRYSNASGDNTIAFGYNSVAKEDRAISLGSTITALQDSIAIGNEISVNKNDIALGKQVSISGENSIALGSLATINDNFSVVVGYSATTSYGNAISLGAWSKTQQEGISIGYIAESYEEGSIAVGSRTYIYGENSIGLGRNATVSGQNSINIGYSSDSQTYFLSGQQSVSIGGNASLFGNNNVLIGHEGIISSRGGVTPNSSTLIGYRAQTSNVNSTAIGADSKALADSAIAINGQALNTGSITIGGEAINNWAVSIGSVSSAQGEYSVSLGRGTKSSGDYSINIGYRQDTDNENSGAYGFRSIAIGSEAGSFNERSISLGTSAKALEDDAISIGSSARAEGARSISLLGIASEQDALAMGSSAQALGEYGIAIGFGSIGSQDNSISIGYSGRATGENAVAIGEEAKSLVDNGVSLGGKAEATEEGSLALGYLSLAQGINSLASGTSSQAIGQNAIAVGYSSKASGNYSISIGTQGSLTDGSVGDFDITLGTNATTTNSSSHNIAIGSSALAYGSNYITSGNSGYSLAIGDTAQALGGKSIAIGNSSHTSQEGGVAIGSNSNVYNSYGINIGSKASTEESYSDEYSVAIGHLVLAYEEGIAIGLNSIAGEDGISLGVNSSSSEQYGIALGYHAQAQEDYGISLGYYANSVGQNSISIGKSSYCADSSSINIGGLINNLSGGALNSGDIVIGFDSISNNIGSGNIILGSGSQALNSGNIALGNDAICSAANSIQLGFGTNDESNSFQYDEVQIVGEPNLLSKRLSVKSVLLYNDNQQRIYQNLFGIHRINGEYTLVDKTQVPVPLTNVDYYIKNYYEDSSYAWQSPYVFVDDTSDPPDPTLTYYYIDQQTGDYTPITGITTWPEYPLYLNEYLPNTDYYTFSNTGSNHSYDEYKISEYNMASPWQEKLIAGEGIEISGNVISATGGGSGTVTDVLVDNVSVVTDGVAHIDLSNIEYDISENQRQIADLQSDVLPLKEGGSEGYVLTHTGSTYMWQPLPEPTSIYDSQIFLGQGGTSGQETINWSRVTNINNEQKAFVFVIEVIDILDYSRTSFTTQPLFVDKFDQNQWTTGTALSSSFEDDAGNGYKIKVVSTGSQGYEQVDFSQTPEPEPGVTYYLYDSGTDTYIQTDTYQQVDTSLYPTPIPGKTYYTYNSLTGEYEEVGGYTLVDQTQTPTPDPDETYYMLDDGEYIQIPPYAYVDTTQESPDPSETYYILDEQTGEFTPTTGVTQWEAGVLYFRFGFQPGLDYYTYESLDQWETGVDYYELAFNMSLTYYKQGVITTSTIYIGYKPFGQSLWDYSPKALEPIDTTQENPDPTATYYFLDEVTGVVTAVTNVSAWQSGGLYFEDHIGITQTYMVA